MRFASGKYSHTPRAFKHERRDCVVRALRVAADLSYEEAHQTLAACGRFDCRTTWPSVMADAAQRHGLVRVFTHKEGTQPIGDDAARYAVDAMRPTLAHFVRTHPTGSFIVRVKKHAVAVVDGIVHDWKFRKNGGSRSRVYSAWGRAE